MAWKNFEYVKKLDENGEMTYRRLLPGSREGVPIEHEVFYNFFDFFDRCFAPLKALVEVGTDSGKEVRISDYAEVLQVLVC